MSRFVWGAVSALLLAAAGMFFWRSADRSAAAVPELSAPPVAELDDVPNTRLAFANLPKAPSASPESKEEKRFARYDKDKNGAISGGEYLLSRRKAYDRLDVNHDGVLQFAEYATKTMLKFSKADADRSGGLNRAEFVTTKAVRKAHRKPDCPTTVMRQFPAPAGKEDSESESDG